jgi:hypothetical protein
MPNSPALPACEQNKLAMSRTREESNKTTKESAGRAQETSSFSKCKSETSYTHDGALVIKSVIGLSEPRRHTERQFFPGVEVGLTGWQRAHSQGAGTGAECAKGIRYAPAEVNQALQNKGIERQIREMYKTASERGITLHQTTETRTHPGTLRLASITYRIDGSKEGQKPIRMLEAEITIENKRDNPRVTVDARKCGAWDA